MSYLVANPEDKFSSDEAHSVLRHIICLKVFPVYIDSQMCGIRILHEETASAFVSRKFLEISPLAIISCCALYGTL